MARAFEDEKCACTSDLATSIRKIRPFVIEEEPETQEFAIFAATDQLLSSPGFTEGAHQTQTDFRFVRVMALSDLDLDAAAILYAVEPRVISHYKQDDLQAAPENRD